ncbi:MAG: hypothetical protein RL685_5349, partial [Pseudomonadota bacterium]
GETWQRIFSLDGDLYGFALSPDGSRIAVGGPEVGVYIASATELEFQPVPTPVRGLRCLRWTAEGLLACGQEMLDGWTVGLTRDEGQSFEALWHQQDLAPLSCAPASRTGTTCPSLWPDVARTIGADPGDVAPAVPGNLGMLGTGGSSASEPPPAAKQDGGCALTVRSSVRAMPALAALLAALAALSLRRRQGTSM